MNVPYNDLRLIHEDIKEEISQVFIEIIDKSAFISGEYVEEFEKSFAKKLGVEYCIGVGNGTEALWASLQMLGIGINDEVIIPANTFFACAEAVEHCGAIPVFVDNDDCYNIDVSKIESSITEKTKVILAVHLYGQLCDITRIKEICNKNNLLLVEDCSQAHFAKFNNRNAGTFGDAACFSFYPGKNLGAMGDAGCIVTNSEQFANDCKLFRNHGEFGKSKHELLGFNTRMDAFQAAVLKLKLKHIDIWTKQRQKIAEIYGRLLNNCDRIILPMVADGNEHVFHLFVIRADNRDELRIFLNNNNIETGIHYPKAIPFLPAYMFGKNKDVLDLKNSYSWSSSLLSLPIFPGMKEEQVRFVAEKIIEFYSLI